jgi:5-formyltetrahydrofolate cyclo-ligase
MESKELQRKNWKKAAKDFSAFSVTDLILKISTHPTFLRARQIGLYAPRGAEVDLTPLWKIRPRHCVFPKVIKGTTKMEFYKIASLSELTQQSFGILEPPSEPSQKAKSFGSEDLILVPGLVFDKRGRRLGSGMGFYDRFLSKQTCFKWGVCFDFFLSHDPLPEEPTDVRMDCVVTEKQWVES